MRKILVLGRKGQVGGDLCRLLEAKGERFTAAGREECDLAVAGSAARLISKELPNIIVNAAAYTAVDRAESEPELAFRINSEAVHEIATQAKRIGAALIHYSTDYVFDGSNSRPWREDDPTGPLNVYGRSKLEGERRIHDSGAASLIFRTSWVFSDVGKNFLVTMLKLGSEREEISVITDQIGSPTSSRSLAELTTDAISHFTAADGAIDMEKIQAAAGIYHATSQEQTSWHGFAEAIFKEARKLGISLRVRSVQPITSEQWPSAAKRPAYSVLCNDKLREKLGYQLPEWKQSLKQVLKSAVRAKPL